MPAAKTLAVLALVGGALLVGRSAMAVEEPRYEVTRRLGDVELRRYAPQVRAVTLVDAGLESAMSEGFRRLAGYIFGGNTGRAKIAMTAPVSATPVKIAMTAPVSATPADGGQTRVAFTMPAALELQALPVPNDPRVVLEAVPAHLVAVVRFSGTTSDARVSKERAALFSALERAGLKRSGEPTLARYDPPWTLPFLRRNELAVDVVE